MRYKRKFRVRVVIIVLAFVLCVFILRTNVSELKKHTVSVTFLSMIFSVFAALCVRKKRILALFCCHLALSLLLFAANYTFTPYETQKEIRAQDLMKLSNMLRDRISQIDRSRLEFESYKSESIDIMKDTSVYDADFKKLFKTDPPDGMFIPFTGRAYVHADTPSFLKPFVAIHELCHRIGISNEGQANLHAFKLCVSSGKEEFMYSAYVYALAHTEHLLTEEQKSARRALPRQAETDLNRMYVRNNFSRLPWKNYADLVYGLLYCMENETLL